MSNNKNIYNQRTIKDINMRSYIIETLIDDINSFAKGANVKTGYANLDTLTSLYPGLYVIGAISSLGKTTFIQQMADQLAKSGQPVIFFSLEQSTLELASKSLARITASKDMNTALTSLDIRMNGNDPRVIDARNEYWLFANNITVVECSFRITIDDITSYVTEYIRKNNIKPIVIVDYLQVIQTPPEKHIPTKEAVDMHVRRLKQLQSDNNLALIVISSLNRANYLAQVDFESFKESGGIEYTADVVWGLQLKVLHDDIFDSASKINEKREKVRIAKASTPRQIELVCLKNRFGISSYSCNFNYYPAYDLFTPSTSNESDKNCFTSLPKGYTTPFDQSNNHTTRKCF